MVLFAVNIFSLFLSLLDKERAPSKKKKKKTPKKKKKKR